MPEAQERSRMTTFSRTRHRSLPCPVAKIIAAVAAALAGSMGIAAGTASAGNVAWSVSIGVPGLAVSAGGPAYGGGYRATGMGHTAPRTRLWRAPTIGPTTRPRSPIPPPSPIPRRPLPRAGRLFRSGRLPGPSSIGARRTGRRASWSPRPPGARPATRPLRTSTDRGSGSDRSLRRGRPKRGASRPARPARPPDAPRRSPPAASLRRRVRSAPPCCRRA